MFSNAIVKPRIKLTLFGSIVQKGKFSAGMPIFVRTLNSVDLPTLGSPTIPTCSEAFHESSRERRYLARILAASERYTQKEFCSYLPMVLPLVENVCLCIGWRENRAIKAHRITFRLLLKRPSRGLSLTSSLAFLGGIFHYRWDVLSDGDEMQVVRERIFDCFLNRFLNHKVNLLWK